MPNLAYHGGNYYSSPDINIMGKPMFSPGYYQNSKMLQSAIDGGWIKKIGGPGAGGNNTNTIVGGALPTNYTPNQVTQAQLSGMNNMQTPQWMMDSYTRKIGQMGGNANPPVPFGVTQSGFPGFMPQPMPQQQSPLPVMPQGSGGKNPAINSAIQGIGPAALGGIGAISAMMPGKQNGTSTYTPSMGIK